MSNELSNKDLIALKQLACEMGGPIHYKSKGELCTLQVRLDDVPKPRPEGTLGRPGERSSYLDSKFANVG